MSAVGSLPLSALWWYSEDVCWSRSEELRIVRHGCHVHVHSRTRVGHLRWIVQGDRDACADDRDQSNAADGQKGARLEALCVALLLCWDALPAAFAHELGNACLLSSIVIALPKLGFRRGRPTGQRGRASVHAHARRSEGPRMSLEWTRLWKRQAEAARDPCFGRIETRHKVSRDRAKLVQIRQVS